jgi:NAD(P)-dependent dehydrogenase (short-subunit alcohol dehydrogenase family)
MAIIITGAAGNLGSVVTEKMLSEGRQVFATVGPHESVDFLQHEHLKAEQIDLLNAGATKTFLEKVIDEKEDHLEGAVLLAGGFGMGSIADTGSEELDKMYRLNFKTAFHIVQPLMQHWQEEQSGGTIIFIGARPALEASAGQNLAAYALSKSLLFQLASFINAGTADHGIKAAVIAPSIIDTPPNREAMPDADPSDWVPPQRIADTISYLFSEAGQMWRETVIRIYNKS